MYSNNSSRNIRTSVENLDLGSTIPPTLEPPFRNSCKHTKAIWVGNSNTVEKRHFNFIFTTSEMSQEIDLCYLKLSKNKIKGPKSTLYLGICR